MLLILILLSKSTSQVLPNDFIWGVSGSAFQTEGAYNISRGASIWDYFQQFPGRIANGDTGKTTDDFYHRYPEDITSLKSLGAKAYRLSISWSRVLPSGDTQNISEAGVQFYLSLLTALNSAGVDPWVNLYHFDLPQTFNTFSNNSTWLDVGMPEKFRAYAEFCFKTFGHLVKHWMTFNEVIDFTWLGYGTGDFAPGRCSPEFADWCKNIGGGGDSSREPYLVAHHVILAHALAVRTYRKSYSRTGGMVGIGINVGFGLPFNVNNPVDVKAVDTSLAFQFGWFADPLVFGEYPQEMTSLITGGRLPGFNESMKALVRGAYDFLGVNYYTTSYIKDTGVVGGNYGNDGRYQGSTVNATGHIIGPQAQSTWLNVYPPGLRGILNWVSKRYSKVKPKLFVLENGVSCPNESQIPLQQALNDSFRVDYIYDHVMTLLDTITDDHIPIHGYFIWSLLDNLEWADGFETRFGLIYVDYKNNLTRYKKESWFLYKSLIQYI
jgi:beta-glucosidase